MSEAMEQWQKLWLNAWQPGANATKQTQAPESNNVWQQMLTQQTEMWQKNLASVFSLPNNHVPSVTEQWQNLPFFQNVQKMYAQTCDFVESQLHSNPAYANLSAEQQDNMAFMTRQYLSAMNPNNYLNRFSSAHKG